MSTFPSRGKAAVIAMPRRSHWWVPPAALELATVGSVVVALAASNAVGLRIGSWIAAIVTVCLTVSAVVMLAEVCASLRPRTPPPPQGPMPSTTAIAAAYLPNEQHHLIGTLRHLLEQCDAAQVICAYNTPRPLPIESGLRRLAARHRHLVVLRVPTSSSKAENVNAALAVATGDIIAIFDADHHSQPGGFERASRWIAAGYDVVQGSCRVRDGRRSRLARTVAAEFDGMYCVTHPGRARVEGFAIFGGSNGYWRAHVLRSTMLDPSMLTEDIDASIRCLAAGARIVTDPSIVSTELAPASCSALWTQRLRWAQGWTQVSRRRLVPALRSPHVVTRARVGLLWQFGWCEVLPWIATIGLGVLIHDLASAGLRGSTMAVSLAAFNLSVGPIHAFAGRARASEAHPRSWYLLYALVSAVAYVEVLNTAKRMGHLRELTGRRNWIVTPRAEEPIVALAA